MKKRKKMCVGGGGGDNLVKIVPGGPNIDVNR